jgi:hypothetical protein
MKGSPLPAHFRDAICTPGRGLCLTDGGFGGAPRILTSKHSGRCIAVSTIYQANDSSLDFSAAF